jgi:hypothetical protein
MAIDLDNVAAFTGIFGDDATYTPVGGSPVTVWADVQEATILGRPGPVFDSVFAPGLGRYAEGRVVAADLAALGVTPSQGDTLTQNDVTWRVEEIRPEVDMLVLALSSDQRFGQGGR